jgi:HSP20 family protein
MANRDLTPWRRGGLSPFGASSFSRDPFLSFRQEMDRLFDDFLTPAPAEGRSFAQQGQALRPSIDVDETEQAYTVTAELPGLAEQDIELSLQENALTISGEKRSERDEEEGGRRYTERSYGRFSRTIPFQAEIDAEKVEASCSNGVLKVTLPKNAKARDQARKIEIKPQAGNGGQASAATGSGQ